MIRTAIIHSNATKIIVFITAVPNLDYSIRSKWKWTSFFSYYSDRVKTDISCPTECEQERKKPHFMRLLSHMHDQRMPPS